MAATYVEDIPSPAPRFDCDTVAKALTEVLLRPASGAIVLGVHGPWGSGKTTLLEAIRRDLAARGLHSTVIWFNAWKFQDREALWRALILHVVARLKDSGGDAKKLTELEESLYRAFTVEEKGPWKLNWRTLIVELISMLLSIVKLDFVGKALKSSTGWFGRIFLGGGDEDGDGGAVLDHDRVEKIASVLERKTVERQVVQVESIEQFLGKFQDLMKTLSAAGHGVFVFIDDLDRCLPEAALQIFEAIKLFLDAPGCRFVVALDREVIRKGLAVRYAAPGAAAAGQSLIDPDEYIEKTISVSYDVATLSRGDALEIMDAFQLPFALDDPQKRLIIAGLGTNPRRVKRFMNTLAVQFHLAALAGVAAPPNPRDLDIVIKLQIVNYRYSGLFAALLADASLIARLQEISTTYRTNLDSGDQQKARAERAAALARERPQIQALEHEEDFWRLMAVKPSFPKDAQGIAKVQQWFRTRV